MTRITKEEAIEIAGSETVKEAMYGACDFTGRVTDGTEWQGYTEFDFSVAFEDQDGNEVLLIAYWYIDSEEVMSTEDLSNLNWEDPDNYEVV